MQGAAAAGADVDRETAYVFNVGSKDVTLIDVADRRVRETRPLGASVRWLSNEQTYWDGARIWTYDFPNDQVQAIAIDPRQVAVTKTIRDSAKAPATVWSCSPTRRRPRSTWRATTSSRSSTSSRATWSPRSGLEHFPETSTSRRTVGSAISRSARRTRSRRSTW